MKWLIGAVWVLLPCMAMGQPTQTIRGKVYDAGSNLPLPGATVSVLQDDSLIAGEASDVDGNYRLADLSVGRYTLVATYIGYESGVRPDVILTSARQEVLDFYLQEAVNTMEEVVVKANTQKGAALNNLALVSARAFSIDETNRYAGSRGDPARMASNYAGVLGNNDASNDIVVRGNSPMGLLWRLDDVNIPNPNHFAVAGNTGGPVSILNNRVLSNSDFFTGAFPAEYGNTVSGVFDLNMRSGNNEQHEFSGQLGFLGTDVLAEGPISKKMGASYLATYRYSTLALFKNFGINIGTDAVPNYQDAAFKINLPISPKTNVSVFGLGGLSAIDILKSDDLDPNTSEVFGDADSDEYFRSRMGVVGAGWTQSLGKNTYARVTLSTSGEYSANNIYRIYRHIDNGQFVLDSLVLTQGYRFEQLKHELSARLNHQFGPRHKLVYGIYLDRFEFDFVDSILNAQTNQFDFRLDYEGGTWLYQPYAQWQWRANEDLTITAGIHGMILGLNNTVAVEPRLAAKYRLSNKSSLQVGLGRHSQMLPGYIYFAGEYNGVEPLLYNKNLDFLKSDHFVLGYEQYLGSNWRLLAEVYYQRLFNVPVTIRPSSYSVLNEGDELNRFFPEPLENTGTGQNKGAELTLERFFNNDFVVLLSGSLFDATYQGSDGLTYNSIFNAGFVCNALATKEWHWGDRSQSTISTGLKMTWAGGKRYTPIDVDSSEAVGYAIPIESARNSEITRDYFRLDVRLEYRLNASKLTHHFGLDLVNVLGIENVFKLRYVGGDTPLQEEYQLGFLPIFYYRIDL